MGQKYKQPQESPWPELIVGLSVHLPICDRQSSSGRGTRKEQPSFLSKCSPNWLSNVHILPPGQTLGDQMVNKECLEVNFFANPGRFRPFFGYTHTVPCRTTGEPLNDSFTWPSVFQSQIAKFIGKLPVRGICCLRFCHVSAANWFPCADVMFTAPQGQRLQYWSFSESDFAN